MSGSGMIAARPEGLAVDMAGEPEGCASDWHLTGEGRSDWQPMTARDRPLFWGEAFTVGDWVLVAGQRVRVVSYEIDPANMTFRYTPLAQPDYADKFAFDLGTSVADLKPMDAEQHHELSPAKSEEPKTWLQSQAPLGSGPVFEGPAVAGALIMDQDRIVGLRILSEAGTPDYSFTLGSPVYRTVDPLPASLPPMSHVVRGFAEDDAVCASGWDGPARCEPFMAFAPGATVTVDNESEPGSWARALGERPDPLWGDRVSGDDEIAAALAVQARLHALGILMLGAAKCTDVQALADRGAIERDGADLFIRRYSESICEIVAELMLPAQSTEG
ncbi:MULTISPECIES: hypothetical protein [Sphingomonadales]|uniref:hypothetical protein n=1 Tax=Sphingomonadales TaxID=204457 RepID=UPI0008270009|nr:MULTISPECIES: hypothetical protein [Sphingomonadales]